MKRILRCAMAWGGVLLALSPLFATQALAAGRSDFVPYNTYEYNSADQSVKAPAGYMVSSVINIGDFGLDPDKARLADICRTQDGTVYLLDAGSGAVHILNGDLSYKGSIRDFTDRDGNAVEIDGAQGLTVYNDQLYIADSDRSRILRTDAGGNVDLIIEKPDTPMLGEEIACIFTKVLIGSEQRIFAIASDVNMGAMVFDQNGRFLTFFGSADVETTAAVLLKSIRRRFMSETQRQNDYQYTPVTLTNFDVDASGLIFTVAKSSTYEDLEGKVRALNAAGKDVFGKEAFGDWEWDREDSNTGTQYIDVTVQEDGYFGLLDATRKRIFVYTPDCELLAVFGAQGELVGTFVNPVALESDGENIWVVDAGKNTIQVFAPTAYVRCMKKAASEMKHGDYQAALSTWQSALTYNTNSRMAHIGIGNCYDYLGDYEAAMQAYKNGYAHDEYSVSFKEWRKEAMRANFIWVLLAVAAVLAAVISLIVLMGRMLRQVEGMPYCRLETRRRLFLYTLLHPSAGFEQLRPRGFASPGISLLIVAAWLAAVILQFFFAGFSFNTNRAVDFQIAFSLLQTVGLYFIFVLANFGFSSFMTGKGKFNEIMTVTAYALIPYIASLFINLALSNVLSQNEGVFMAVVSVIGLVWSAAILFAGMMTIHQYSVGKTVLSFLVTIVGMLILVFLMVLVITLAAQVMSFVDSIIREVSIR